MARRNRRLSDREIQALCDQQISTASGWYSGELADERATAMELYLGEPLGDEVEGRSQVRTREVLDTVESVLPSLMRIFADAENIVAFEPVGPEDEETAQQESDVIQRVFWKDNRGFHNLYAFLKDGLVSKTGVLKVYWDDTSEREREEYRGLDDTELTILLSDPSAEIEIQAYSPRDDGLHDIVILATRSDGRCVIEPCPPEEFGVDRDARSIYPEDATFCYHRVRKTKSDLVEMGFDRAMVQDLPTSDDVETQERLSRRNLDDEQEFYRSGEHWSMHRVWVSECYVRVDRDGDGIAELLKVTLSGAESGYSSGSTLLDIEEIDRVPFVTWSPVLLTHKFYGLSMADLTADLQEIKTSLVRQMLDSTYQSNNGRLMVNENVHLDDLLTSRPGGIGRTKGKDPPSNHFAPIPQQPLPPQSFEMLEYLDDMRQRRTGVGEEVGALDSNALANVNTGVAALAYDAARSRIELIARLCAEVGLRPLFLRMHELMRKNSKSSKGIAIKLRNGWATVKPQDWRERNDMTVKVGVGRASRERRLIALADVMEKQATAIQGGGLNVVLTAEHAYRAVSDYTRELGLEESLYWMDPRQAPPQQQGPDYNAAQLQIQGAMVEAQMQRNAVEARKIESTERVRQMELQVRAEEAELRAQLESLKAESGLLQKRLEHADKASETELKEAIAQREQERKDVEVALEAQRAAAERQIDVYRSLLQSGTALTVEQMRQLDGGETQPLFADLVGQLSAHLERGLEAVSEAARQNIEAGIRATNDVRAEVMEMRAASDAPRVVERDESGRIVSIGGRAVRRNADGLVESIG